VGIAGDFVRIVVAGFLGAVLARALRLPGPTVVQPAVEGGIETVRQALDRFELLREEIDFCTASVRGQLCARDR
jgi:hypothetical protein